MVFRNYGHVFQTNPSGHGKALPLTVFHAHHTAICSSPEHIFRAHRQSHGGGAIEVQIAMLAINSIDPNRCRSPNGSLRSSSERIDTAPRQSFSPGQRCDLFVAKTVQAALCSHPDVVFPVLQQTPHKISRQPVGLRKPLHLVRIIRIRGTQAGNSLSESSDPRVSLAVPQDLVDVESLSRPTPAEHLDFVDCSCKAVRTGNPNDSACVFTQPELAFGYFCEPKLRIAWVETKDGGIRAQPYRTISILKQSRRERSRQFYRTANLLLGFAAD